MLSSPTGAPRPLSSEASSSLRESAATPPKSDESGWRRAPLVLFAILIVSFALNVSFIGWGLPALWHPDEIVSLAWFMAKRGTLEPVNFLYPTFHIYLVFFGIVVPESIARAGSGAWQTGIFASTPSVPELTLDARILSAAMATATVFVVYRCTVQVWGRATALLAAAYLSLSAGFVGFAHFATLEVPTVFWTVLAFHFACRGLLEESVSLYFIAALVTGLAASTKYVGVLIGLPILASLFWTANQRKGAGRSTLRATGLSLVALALIVVGFLFGSPEILADPVAFLRDVLALVFFQPAYAGARERGFLPHLFNLADLLGPFLFPVCLAGYAYGCFRAVRHRDGVSALLVAAATTYYLAMGSMWFHPARYVLAALPFLVMLGARCSVQLLAISRRTSPVGANAAAISVAVGLIVSAAYCLSGVLQFRDDDRVLAARWFTRHVARDATIELPTVYGPSLPAEFSAVRTTPGAFLPASLVRTREDPTYVEISRRLDHLEQWALHEAPSSRGRRISSGGTVEETSEYSVEALLRRRPEYLVLAKRWYGLFLASSDAAHSAFPIQRRLYSALLDGGTPYRRVADFTAGRSRWMTPRFEFVNGGIQILKWKDVPKGR